jgi:phosphohistidine phosphatase
MNLYIVRHAIAEPLEESASEEEDSQRSLTEQGRKKFRKFAKQLRDMGVQDMGVQVNLILASPYVRAADTAAILRKKLDLGKDQLVTTEQLAPGGDTRQLVSELSGKYGKLQSIALVGHEPGLSRLISTLISGDPSLPITLRKGGVCCLAADKLEYGRCATLEWLIAPAQLEDTAG